MESLSSEEQKKKELEEKLEKSSISDFDNTPKDNPNKTIFLGIGIIVVSIIWLFAGLANDYLFYYPFILAALGLYFIFKGLIAAGKKGSSVDRKDILDDDLQ
ncbi:MAG: hypothetical protein MI810_04940 [Flavobacteriales bacterium]|nr:hypothetical protein [Flavobacteriales bacterium]